MVWNFSFKSDFSCGKNRSRREPNKGAESPEWFDVLPKNSVPHKIYAPGYCCVGAANHQWPIAVAFWIIWIVSVEECSSLMKNLMQIHCCTCSVILNVMATQYTYSLNGSYHPHWLVQWSFYCSRICIPVHSPWPPGYIDVAQTILVMLIMAGIFWTDLLYLQFSLSK